MNYSYICTELFLKKTMVSEIKSSCSVVDSGKNYFEPLTEEQLELIKRNEVIVDYAKGETICKQGAFASHIVVIEQGFVKITIEDCNKSLILKVITEGNILGLTALSDVNTTFQYSAVAYVDTRAKLIDVNIFKEIVKNNSDFSYKLLTLLASNNVQIYNRFFCLTNKQSYGKLADILLCLSDRVYKKTEFDLLLSRKDLAELSDISTENVIRMLKKFKEDGLIELEGKRLKIKNYKSLMKISTLG